MDVTRRLFLKLLGVATGSVAFGEDLIGLSELKDKRGIRIRESSAYDVFSDRYYFRYDILTRQGVQLCVTVLGHISEDPERYRKPAINLLRHEMKQRRICYTDLIDMPLPENVESNIIEI